MQRLQTAAVLAILAAILVVVIEQSGAFTATPLLQVDDYTEYWAAGRLNADGRNPYDPSQLLPLQLGVGRVEGVPVMMWNPPYTLVIAMPLALLSYPTSRVIWFLMTLGAVAIASRWLWLDLGGRKDQVLAPLALAFTFYPTLALLQTGQIGGLLLFGLAGFLHFQGRRDYLAGGFGALLAIKPHILYLVWPVLALRALALGERRQAFGLVVALAGASGAAAATNPRVWLQYLDAVRSYPPSDWATPTLGGLLRWLMGPEQLYLQFVPVLIGLAWLAVAWTRRSSAWDWHREAPMLALVSVITAAYGWSSDKVVLLAALMPVAVLVSNAQATRVRRLSVAAGYIALDGVALWQHAGANDVEYVWLGPALLLWYLAAHQMLAAPPAPAAAR